MVTITCCAVYLNFISLLVDIQVQGCTVLCEIPHCVSLDFITKICQIQIENEKNNVQ